ncbi:MAG: hypothetical protein WCK29_04100, partial [archaeon]
MNLNKLFIAFFVLLFLISFSSALQSNQSINASNQIADAQNKIDTLVSRGIPTDRINESFNQVNQLYSAQLALENTGTNA